MAREFLSFILSKRGPTAFDRFMAAVNACEQQKYIADTLLQQLAPASDSTDSASSASETDEEIIRKVTGCISLPCVTPINLGHFANLCTTHACLICWVTVFIANILYIDRHLSDVRLCILAALRQSQSQLFLSFSN